MTAFTPVSRTTTGQATFTKPETDTLVQLQVSGDYTGLTFAIEGTIDGTNWKGLGAIQNDSRSHVTGNISPSNGTVVIYDVRCPGYVGVRVNVSAISGGTVAVAGKSGSYVGLPDNVPNGSSPASIGSSGATLSILGQTAVSAANGIVAFAGGGQGSATQLTSKINRVTTVASANDSVKLPAAVAGLSITVFNKGGGNSLNVFPGTGDAINALGANAAYALAATKGVILECSVAGQWDSILTA